MSRRAKIALALLVIAVVAGAFYVRALWRRVGPTARPHDLEEKARREITQPAVETRGEATVRARLYWAGKQPGALAPVEVELALSPDPAQRARQVLNELIVSVPAPAQRTMPLEITLLEFYLLPDGTAVADFSHALASATPSGILSEQMALESIVRTLEANVPAVRRLKILVQGQEMETLAGHVDLGGFIALRSAGGKSEAAAWPLTQPPAPGKLKP